MAMAGSSRRSWENKGRIQARRGVLHAPAPAASDGGQGLRVGKPHGEGAGESSPAGLERDAPGSFSPTEARREAEE